MNQDDVQACPIWVTDEEAIRQLLGALIDKLDRKVKPQVRIDEKTTPQLYNFNDYDTPYLWSLIEQLSISYQIVGIKLKKTTVDQEIYEKAQIRLNVEHENTIRQWLGRPKLDTYLGVWQSAVHNHNWDTTEREAFALSHPIKHPQISAEEIVRSIIATREALTEKMTLRALSAKCFWGDSKFLDNKADYISALFPEHAKNIKPRPLLVNVLIPDNFTSVLFIENQDTFIMLTDHIINTALPEESVLNKLALVYCAGFRGSAARIREKDNAIFSLLSGTHSKSITHFKSWWRKDDGASIPCYFWGDLDYSGLGILGALRKIFPDMQAWTPGYDAMVSYHQSSISHSMACAGKDNQKDPGQIGSYMQCDNMDYNYADEILLPLLRKTEKFLDQEVVDISDLN